MRLRILHTADWHLGHSLHGMSREHEHARFLDWLLETLEARAADALLIAGDLFDSANPPASAQAMLYRFVVEAQRRLPALQMVLIAGNHDSAARLEAPSPLLDALGVRVVGAVRRRADGSLDLDHLLVPLRGKGGAVAAWCAAVPFLRPADLRARSEEDADPLVAGVAALYAEVLAAAEGARRPDQALLALGHCYMVGTQLSDLSERRILGGNQHALPVGLFPPSLSYVALGHLHLAQTVGGRPEVRYSGSPIPLALDERHYPHQVIQADFVEGRLDGCESLHVPRLVDIVRFPRTGSATLAEVEQLLAAHPFDPELPTDHHPYVEVAVRLERPDPTLRQRVEAALAGHPARLLKLTTEYAGVAAGLAALHPTQRLDALQPEGVFRERYRQQYQDDPPEPLLNAFHALLEQVQGSET